MGGEIRRIEITATTYDIDHWHPGWLAAATASDYAGYHDWAFGELEKHMREAGRAWIKAHPDLFDGSIA